MTLAGPVAVTDDKATVTCPAGGLAPLGTMTCTASYTITQADLDAGHVTNTAQAHANGTNSNVDDETVTAVQSPALTILKTATPATFSAVGNIISYSFKVTNTGNVTLAGPVTVTDDKATVTCPAGGLAPLAFTTCTASYTITQADLDTGHVTNTAQAHANGTNSNVDDETVTAVQGPGLTILKTASPTTYSAVGNVIGYSFKVTNTGNVTLIAPFTVDDDKATNETCPGTPTSLAPGAFITCMASYSVTQTDVDNGSVTNVASAKGFFGTTPVVSPTDTATVTALVGTSLGLMKTDDLNPNKYDHIGQVVTYTLTATNTGLTTLHAVSVSDAPALAGFNCTPSVPVASLAPGATVVCTGTHSITQGDLDAGFFTDKASAASMDASVADVPDTVFAAQTATVSLDKTSNATGTNVVDDVVTYSYLVTNTGSVTITSFTVSDPHTGLSALTCAPTAQGASLAPAATTTCTATYTVTQADINAGTISNTGTVTGTTATAGPVTASDPYSTPVAQTATVAIDKTSNATGTNVVDDVVTYSYLVTNTGT